MKKILGWLALSLLSTGAFAQLYQTTASEVTAEEAQELFLRLRNDNEKMGSKSECFQRAHLWAHLAETESNINMDKTYLFFTYKFNMKHRVTSRWGRSFTWWFHVAPTVRVNGELWALDATFTDRAMPMQEWAKSLMQDPEECVELSNLQDYADDRNSTAGYRNANAARETCYYTNTPKFVYQPLQIGLFENKKGMQVGQSYTPNGWEPRFLKWAVPAYSDSNRRKEVKRKMGI